jgi:hypothetical protein
MVERDSDVSGKRTAMPNITNRCDISPDANQSNEAKRPQIQKGWLIRLPKSLLL